MQAKKSGIWQFLLTIYYFICVVDKCISHPPAFIIHSMGRSPGDSVSLELLEPGGLGY